MGRVVACFAAPLKDAGIGAARLQRPSVSSGSMGSRSFDADSITWGNATLRDIPLGACTVQIQQELQLVLS